MFAVKSGEKQDPSLLVIPIRYSKTSIWSQHLARQHSRHLAHSPCCVAQVIQSVANTTIFTTVFYLTGQLQQATTRRSARWPSSCRAKSEGQQLKRPSFCSSQVQMTGGASLSLPLQHVHFIGLCEANIFFISLFLFFFFGNAGCPFTFRIKCGPFFPVHMVCAFAWNAALLLSANATVSLVEGMVSFPWHFSSACAVLLHTWRNFFVNDLWNNNLIHWQVLHWLRQCLW